MIHFLKIMPGLIAVGFALWIGITAWQTVQQLTSADFPAALVLLQKHGIKGQIESAQVVNADRKVYLQAHVRVAPGNVQEVLVPLGHYDKRPALAGK